MGWENPANFSVLLPDGDIATEQWVSAQFPEQFRQRTDNPVTPYEFGGVGDGVADDTAALQGALDAATRRIFLPAGTWRVTAGLVYRTSRTVIEGVGDLSIIACDGAQVPTLLQASATGLGRCGLRNVKLLQTTAPIPLGSIGLDTSDMPNFIAENVRIEAFDTGQRIADVASTSFYSHYESLQIFDCNNGIRVEGTQANQNTWINPRIRPKAGGDGIGISLNDTRGATFIAADVEASVQGVTIGVYLDPSVRECWFINPWIENCFVGLQVSSGVRRCGIIGGSITSNGTDIANSADPTEFTFLSTSRTGQTQWSLGYVLRGAGTPEGTVVAPVGTMFLRSDGGAGTTLYVKQTGTGNTGWVGK